MRERDASSMCAVNEVCAISLWKVEILLRTFFQMANLCYVVDMYPKQNPFQVASLNIASYTILWSMPTRLYVCPSITSVIDPSEITLDPTHKSTRPASWNLFPVVDIGGFKWYGMECYYSEYNALELIMLPCDFCSLDIEVLVEDSDTLL